MTKPNLTIDERFWMKVQKSNGCWEWTAYRDPDGYGRFGWARKRRSENILAHRVSWELHYGPIPEGLWICHHCDNPSCVRPDHLFLGDRSMNMKDCAAKGRLAVHKVFSKTHCKRGHPYTPENSYIFPSGRARMCRTCVQTVYIIRAKNKKNRKGLP
jgi:hypothetical protein